MKSYIKILLTILLLTSLSTFAQEWKVPEIKKAKTANFKFNDETVKTGEDLFKANCMSCHGTPGMNNFAAMTPPPGDPATEKFQVQTDGELFYKITNGRALMPSFKSILSDKERWNIISYFRSFNKSYIQPDTIPAKGFVDYIIKMDIEKMDDSNKVKITVTAFTAEDPTPIKVSGADLTLFASRTFGLLPVSEKVVTNINGEAIFRFPQDLPGDTAGNINLTVRMVDEIGNFGEAESSIILPVGKPFFPTSLTDERAMWNVRSKAPIWLILTYCGAVIIVFGFIFFILGQLLKIRKIGLLSDKKTNPEH